MKSLKNFETFEQPRNECKKVMKFAVKKRRYGDNKHC